MKGKWILRILIIVGGLLLKYNNSPPDIQEFILHGIKAILILYIAYGIWLMLYSYKGNSGNHIKLFTKYWNIEKGFFYKPTYKEACDLHPNKDGDQSWVDDFDDPITSNIHLIVNPVCWLILFYLKIEIWFTKHLNI